MTAATAKTALKPGKTFGQGASKTAEHLKTTGSAYLLLFFLGPIGAHKFYLGRPSLGALYAAAWVGFWIMFVSKSNAVVAMGLLFLLCFALTLDAMTLGEQTRVANERLAGESHDSVLSRPSLFIAKDEGFDHRAADAAIERFLEMSAVSPTQQRRVASGEKKAFGRRS